MKWCGRPGACGVERLQGRVWNCLLQGAARRPTDAVNIAMQNVSSLQCYLWDITLLYAQRRDLSELSRQIAHLQVVLMTHLEPP